MSTVLRPELPELPRQMHGLPVSDRGYPVPWFVLWQDKSGEPCERGHGTPEFRMQHPNAAPEAHNRGKCWVCGGFLGRFKAFTLGPMCVVNRTTGEPPSHTECSDWSARACPFLSRPHARRREAGLPEDATAPGMSIKRNPGVAVVWVTQHYGLNRVDNGTLFAIGRPREIRWYCEGRTATRAEIMDSIESGLPALREAAEGNIIEENELQSMLKNALKLVPA